MSNNKSLVPEAREGLDRFKMEAASEVGVTLKQGYNGDLTSKQAGSVGGQMVKKIFPERTAMFVRNNRRVLNHKTEIHFTVDMAV